MIDFDKQGTLKLRPIDPGDADNMIRPILIPEEKIISAFKSVRDMIIFTDRRIISVNVQGITGKKKDFTSMPYKKVQVFSVETAGAFDLDSELELWFSGVGKLKFEFTAGTDITTLCRVISAYILIGNVLIWVGLCRFYFE